MCKLIEIFRSNVNLFDSKLDKDLLYNVGTGRSVSDEISDFLLNVDILGERLKTNFIVVQKKKITLKVESH